MTTPNPPSSLGRRVRRFFVTLGISLVAAGVAAGAMWVRQRPVVRALQARVDDAAGACDGQLESVRAERDAARRNARRLFAFVDVTRARAELSRGNFGNARSRAESAARHLRDGGDAELARQTEALDIQVTEDLQSTQAALASLAGAIEASIDAPTPP